MSIASEITRLTNAKAGIKTALEGKGITVPDNAKLDTYGTLVNSIESGIDTSDADATPSDLAQGKTAYVNGVKMEGTLREDDGQWVQNALDVELLDGNIVRVKSLIVANDGVSEFIARSGFTKYSTINPDRLSTVIGLTANKIKSGESILGVQGTVIEGIDTSDATATANDIIKDKTAYINGQKVVGTIPVGQNFKAKTANSTVRNSSIDRRLYFDNLPWGTQLLEDSKSEVRIGANWDNVASSIGLSANIIKSGETILGIEGTLEPKLPTYASVATNWGSVEVIDDTAQKFIRTSGTIMTSQTAEQNEKANIEIQYSRLVDAINLTPDKIKSGESVLGVSGSYQGITADKTIQAEDAELETVQEITGNNDIGLSIISNPLTQSKLFEQGSMIEMHPTFEQLATILGITPDKIKAGEIICGVEGTYTGESTPTE